MGDAYAGMGQYELAVQNYRRAATEAPENPLPLYRLGMLYLKRNEIPNAQESFENCLNLQPDYFLAQVGLIRCALNAGDYRKAHLLLGQIPEERRGGGDVLFLQGMLYFYLNDFDRARAMFSEAVKVDPLHTEAKRMLETLPE